MDGEPQQIRLAAKKLAGVRVTGSLQMTIQTLLLIETMYPPGETVDKGMRFSFELDGDGRLLKVKFDDKNAAHHKLMRYHSLCKDKSELNEGGEFTLVVDL